MLNGSLDKMERSGESKKLKCVTLAVALITLRCWSLRVEVRDVSPARPAQPRGEIKSPSQR